MPKKQKNATSLSALMKNLSSVVDETKRMEYIPIYEQQLDGLKGVQFSPDGTCTLFAQNNYVRLFERSKEVISIREAEPIYDFAWYPNMISTDPATCCFATVSRIGVVHLWDAYQNELLRASYTLQNEGGEPSWGLSIGMNSRKVFCGSKSLIYIWDLERPGTPFQRKQLHKGASHLVSCFAFSPEDEETYAIGLYSGEITIFSKDDRVLFHVNAQPGGVTQLKYSSCGRFLWCGGRRSNQIVCFDVRSGYHEVVFAVPRICRTNQRIQFDFFQNDEFGTVLASGDSQSHCAQFYPIRDKVTPCGEITDNSVINSVCFKPNEPRILASVSGTRKLPKCSVFSDSDSDTEEQGAFKIWRSS